ncbi:MAG: thiamine phosphate synthase [Prevotellaceae bacterium]|nr:thiamine phosphate synthase [Prevotellaceae bacterium]
MTLQFISHYTDRYTYVEAVRMALEGGCRWVQLRMKEADTRRLYDTALEVLPLCRAAGAKLVVDDRLDVALAAAADGVHLGQRDLPVAKARALAGSGFIIGGTANTFEQVKAHALAGADYVGVGPFRFTTTKQGLAPVLGLEGYRRIVARMKAEGIRLPLIAIGGITRQDIPALAATGVDGIALSGSVLHATSPVEEMRLTLQALEGGLSI